MNRQMDGRSFAQRCPCAVVVDVEGTILDSNDARAGAWVTVLRESGYDNVWFNAVRPLIGMGNERILMHTVGLTLDNEDGKRLVKRHNELFNGQYLGLLRPFVGARTLLRLMRSQGFKLVAYSTVADEPQLVSLLCAAGVQDLFDSAVTCDEAQRTVPDPDLLEIAVWRSGHLKRDAAILADTPYDVQAARRARISSVALRSGGWIDPALLGAVAIYDDVSDLLTNYESSPFAPDEPLLKRASFSRSSGTGASTDGQAPVPAS
jgi:phosphoglycolate phosphatase-like HAD superfamily hydrolase